MRSIAAHVEQFDGEFYLSALAAVAAADGMTAPEVEYIRNQAQLLGLDAERALASGVTLANLPLSSTVITRRLAHRDCFVLANVDGPPNDHERRVLNELRARLQIEPRTAERIEDWTVRYSELVTEGEALLAKE